MSTLRKRGNSIKIGKKKTKEDTTNIEKNNVQLSSQSK